MWNFIKNVFTVVVGLILFNILVLSGILLLVGVSSTKNTETINNQSVFQLKLDKEIVERENEKLFSGTSILPSGSTISLIELKRAIALAKKDDKIKGIYLDLSTVQAGFATLEEIRNALLDFKKSSKFIVAYSEYYSEGAYYLASVADKIILPPSGSLEFNGLESEVVFFKGALEKLDIKVEIFKVGTFKSAVEPFFLDKMSEPNKTQVASFMNSIYDVYLKNVALSRSIDKSRLKIISDSMLVRNAKDALNYKLITDLAYKNEADDFMRAKMNLSEKDELNFISYKTIVDNDINLNTNEAKVGVIIANGEIISGRGSDDVIGSETIAEQIKKAREDDNVKAIVLRINSPGGSALASDVIWNEVVLTKGIKPIIASMSDVAASGGYYIAMACDTIVAQPTTITGSIGVFGLVLNTEKFLKDKLGITTDRVKTGEFSDIGSSTRSLTIYEKTIIQKEVDGIYEDFTSKAALGRKMTQEQLKKIAEGRVWSGNEALENKLIDVIGGLEDAIAIAQNKANLEGNYSVVYLPEQKNLFWKDVISGIGDEESAKWNKLKSELGLFFPYFTSIKEIEKLEGVQARLPYKLIVR